MIKKIAMLGAGNGGFATTAEMTLKGYDVTLFEFPEFKGSLEPIRKHGGIAIFGPETWGSKTPTAFAKIPKERLTTDIKQAVKGADFVKISVICQGQRKMAELVAPHLEDGQIVFFDSAPGGALELAKAMRDKGLKKDIVIGETNNLAYLARKVGPATVRAIIKPDAIFAAAFPAKDTPKLMKAVNELHPLIKQGTNVFETILLDLNALDHIPTGLLNVSWLEGTNRAFGYWTDGGTPSTIRCIDEFNNETLAIRKTLGFKEQRVQKDWIYAQGFINKPAATTLEAFQHSDMSQAVVYGKPGIFKTFDIITDTIPYGLTLISSIGDMVGVETPVIDSFITIGSVVCETDFWKEGRTAEKLGVPKGLNVKQLNRFLYEGKV